MTDIHTEVINGVEYRLVEIRGRSKLISRSGDAINPYKRNQPCTIHLNKDGYPCFGGGIPVHAYVAKAWVDGYFDGAEVNHKDFDRSNYSADNLEWVTHLDNVRYSSDVDRYNKPTGERNPNYGNKKLHNFLLENPEYKILYYSRPGTSNGMACKVDVFDLNMEYVRSFDLIKDCARWLCEVFNKPEDKIPHVQSAISMSMKKNRPYKGYYIVKKE